MAMPTCDVLAMDVGRFGWWDVLTETDWYVLTDYQLYWGSITHIIVVTHR